MRCEYYPKPRCRGAKATKEVQVSYNEYEQDHLSLCDSCAEFVAKDAKSHGYGVAVKKIRST